MVLAFANAIGDARDDLRFVRNIPAKTPDLSFLGVYSADQTPDAIPGRAVL